MENDLVESDIDLDVDVYKVSHHGSRTSSSKEFVEAITPIISIISVGEGNQYNLPNQETLDNLNIIGSQVYRTDEEGTIILKTNGEQIKVETKSKGINNIFSTENIMTNDDSLTTNNSNNNEVGTPVYITKTGSKYHKANCKTLTHSKIETSLKEAIEKGFQACKICKP